MLASKSFVFQVHKDLVAGLISQDEARRMLYPDLAESEEKKDRNMSIDTSGVITEEEARLRLGKPIEVRTIWVYPASRGIGGHFNNYISYYAGEETSGTRGWDQTVREAERDLRDAPKVAP